MIERSAPAGDDVGDGWPRRRGRPSPAPGPARAQPRQLLPPRPPPPGPGPARSWPRHDHPAPGWSPRPAARRRRPARPPPPRVCRRCRIPPPPAPQRAHRRRRTRRRPCRPRRDRPRRCPLAAPGVHRAEIGAPPTAADGEPDPTVPRTPAPPNTSAPPTLVVPSGTRTAPAKLISTPRPVDRGLDATASASRRFPGPSFRVVGRTGCPGQHHRDVAAVGQVQPEGGLLQGVGAVGDDDSVGLPRRRLDRRGDAQPVGGLSASRPATTGRRPRRRSRRPGRRRAARRPQGPVGAGFGGDRSAGGDHDEARHARHHGSRGPGGPVRE